MSKEVRVLFLTGLTLIIYAFSIYTTSGALVFPFPINELILLIVICQFVFWHHNQRRIALTTLGIGLFSLLGNELIYSLFLDQETMLTLSNSLITDISLLIASLLIVIFGVQTIRAQNNLLAKTLSIFGIITFVSSVTILPSIYTFYAYTFMLISVLIQPVHKPYHLIWMLLFMLESTKFITIVINN